MAVRVFRANVGGGRAETSLKGAKLELLRVWVLYAYVSASENLSQVPGCPTTLWQKAASRVHFNR